MTNIEKIENEIKIIKQRLIDFKSDFNTNEQAVRTQLIEPILKVLGWDIHNPNIVKPNAIDQYGKIPDYTLYKNGEKTLIVEAKNISAKLTDNKIIAQIGTYCYSSGDGIEFGILTNGAKWLLFKTYEKNPNNRIIWCVDIENDEIEKIINPFVSVSYDIIENLDKSLKDIRLLDEVWAKMDMTVDGIVQSLSQSLLKKTKENNKDFIIDNKNLLSYTKEKFFDIINNIEEDKVEDFGIADTNVMYNKPIKKSVEKIKVYFPDGVVIDNEKSSLTLVECIKKIGVEKIYKLNLIQSNIYFVSREKSDRYTQHEVDGYLVMTHTDTKSKKKILEKISETLNLDLKIEIYST
jgi:predicted type IV restriction endonuclease